MRGLEAAQQLVERVQHLLGEPLADLVLELAAVVEERGEALGAREAEEPRLAEQQPQRGRDRPARGLDHVRDAEVEPARALAARRGDEAQRAAVEEQARRHAGLAQQPLHPAVRRGLELAGLAHHAVEVLAGLEDPHEELPRGRAVLRLPLADGEVGAQRLAVVGQRHLELGRDRATRSVPA